MRKKIATLSALWANRASLATRAILAALSALLPCAPSYAGQTIVHGARIWNAPDHTRIVIDTGAPIRHTIFTLDNPSRLVVDLSDASFNGTLPDVSSRDRIVAGLRSGVRDGDDLRLVMDLKQPARVKSFELAPNDSYGHRLVVDLTPKNDMGGNSPKRPAGSPPAGAIGTSSGTSANTGSELATLSADPGADRDKSAPPFVSTQPAGGRQRDVVVAVDAGHGGQDPGAIGRSGTREKDVTLSIARKLAALIDRQHGMQAVLIRDGDYFVPLRQRIAKARKHQADLFVSIHADAFNDPSVRGSSVYTLSNGGASSEAAKWLAARENSADLIGGVNLAERNDVLASVLLDMTQNATIEHSGIAATRVLEKLRSLGDVHQSRIQQAGFVVLKSPDIPSMLVETAFISNPNEEKRLRSGSYQNKLARSLLAGILDYFRDYPPPGTRFARQPDAPDDDATSHARDADVGNEDQVALTIRGGGLGHGSEGLELGGERVGIIQAPTVSGG